MLTGFGVAIAALLMIALGYMTYSKVKKESDGVAGPSTDYKPKEKRVAGTDD
jgi:hypothetical protein